MYIIINCSNNRFIQPLLACHHTNLPFLWQVYSSQRGTRHHRHPSLQSRVSQKRTTRGCTPLTPYWSQSSSWALWASCSERCAPASCCTAPAPTAAYRPAPPPPWRTTTSNSTTASSTRSNSTNSAAAPRREKEKAIRKGKGRWKEREGWQSPCENLPLSSSFCFSSLYSSAAQIPGCTGNKKATFELKRELVFLFRKALHSPVLVVLWQNEPLSKKLMDCSVLGLKSKYLHISSTDSWSTNREMFIDAS